MKTADAWTCTMHPDFKSARPGFCPKCGMSLVSESSFQAREKAPVKERAAPREPDKGHCC